MSSPCTRCHAPVYFAEKVSSLGKNWQRFCLNCERCHKTLSSGSHAEHDGKPDCHKPCYAALFGPKGVNISGVGSYIYDTPPTTPQNPPPWSTVSPSMASTSEKVLVKQVPKAPSYKKTFAGETALCPGCGKAVFLAEKVTSLGRNWHRPCLRCQRCKKTLLSGSHAEHDGVPYCHVHCYRYLFEPKEVTIGDVGCYTYDSCTVKSEIPDHY